MCHVTQVANHSAFMPSVHAATPPRRHPCRFPALVSPLKGWTFIHTVCTVTQGSPSSFHFWFMLEARDFPLAENTQDHPYPSLLLGLYGRRKGHADALHVMFINPIRAFRIMSKGLAEKNQHQRKQPRESCIGNGITNTQQVCKTRNTLTVVQTPRPRDTSRKHITHIIPGATTVIYKG